MPRRVQHVSRSAEECQGVCWSAKKCNVVPVSMGQYPELYSVSILSTGVFEIVLFFFFTLK